jgi:hypothetical protein
LIFLLPVSIKALVDVNAAKAPIITSSNPKIEKQVAKTPPSIRKKPVDDPNGPNVLSNIFFIIIAKTSSLISVL